MRLGWEPRADSRSIRSVREVGRGVRDGPTSRCHLWSRRLESVRRERGVEVIREVRRAEIWEGEGEGEERASRRDVFWRWREEGTSEGNVAERAVVEEENGGRAALSRKAL